MLSKQSTHTLPIKSNTPSLIGSGAERALPELIGNTFAYKSKSNGKVTDVDLENNIATLQYDNGEVAAIDLSIRNVKNSGGGFYISSQLSLKNNIIKGKTFKEGDILAYDKSFFDETVTGSLSYKIGKLVPVAMFQLDQTYEDSVAISNRFADDSAAEITLLRSISLSPKANLQKVVKVNDTVTPNSPLAIFENISDDEMTSSLLDAIGAEFEETINDLTTNVVKAKYGGVITEIRVFYNYDIEEYSSSIKKFISNMEKLADKRKTKAESAKGNEPIRINYPEFVNTDKIHGEKFDGILIDVYIKTVDKPGVGDKFSVNACKGIVAKVFNDGEEPITEDNVIVDYVFSPLSITSRMTTDIFFTMWTNAVLLKLKEDIKNILK